MNYTTFIGLFAASMTTIAFLPQVIKSWRTKSVDDISLFMYIILMVGQFSWIVYGVYIHSLPIILSDIIIFILTVTMLSFKYIYKRK